MSFDGFEHEAAGKDGQAAQQALLRLGEQVIAPLDGATQSLLTWQSRPRAAGQQTKPVVEAACDLFHREGADLGGGQFHRKRDAVETSTNLLDDGSTSVRQLESWIRRPRPLDEQSYGLSLDQQSGGGRTRSAARLGVRHRKRRDTPGYLTLDGERLAAGGEDVKIRAGLQECLG